MKRRKVWLTWPKKRNGKRKVRPLHIQDWNPSERHKTVTVTLGRHDTDYHTFVLTPSSPHNNTTSKVVWEVNSPGLYSNYSRHLCGSTLMLTAASISHLYPIFPDMALQMAQEFKRLKWLAPEIAYNVPTVRSSWFLSPRARSLYKQPLW